MAALNFPNSPSNNDTHTENGLTFKWNGTIWKKVGPAYTDTTNLNVTGIGTIAGNFHVGGVLTYEDVKNVDAVGIVTARDHIKITTDNKSLYLGASDDFQLFHNGSHNIIKSNNGNLYFQDSDYIEIGDPSGKVSIGCVPGGATNLRYNGNTKLATNNTGVTVTGTVAATSYTGDGSNLTGITGTTINSNADNRIITGSGTANTLNGESTLTYNGTTLNLADQKTITLGDSGDLKIEHDGGNSFIDEAGTGKLLIRSNNQVDITSTSNASMIEMIVGGAVKAYHNGNLKLETTSSGVTVTGGIQATGSNTSITCNTTNSNITFTSSGSNANLNHYASGSNSQIKLFSTGSNSVYKLDANGSNGLGYLDGLNGVRLYHGGSFSNQKFTTTSSGVTVTGDITISDKIIHDGDTNTAIRFPAADTITAETGGSERLRIDSSGRLLVGHTSTVDTSTYNSKIQVMATDATASITVGRFGDNASSTSINFSKSRAASIGSHSSGDLHNNDPIGSIFWWGSDGGDYEEAARITAEADAAFTTSSTPGALTFHTTESNATTATERLRIDSAGKVYIGNQSNAASSAYFDKETDGDYKFNIHSSTSTVANRAITFNIRSNVEAMRIDSSSNVHMGNSGAPSFASVSGNTVGGLEIHNLGNDTAACLKLTGNNNTGGSPGQETYTQLEHRGGNLTFNINHNGSERFKIEPSGNIRIFDHLCVDKAFETLTGNGVNAKLQVNCGSNNYDGIMIGGGYNRSTITTGGNYDLVLTSNAYPANATSSGIRFLCGSNGGGGPNERMRIYSEGYVTKPAQPRFMAYRNGSSITNISNGVITGWNAVKYNVGNGFSNGTKFTAPITGTYMFGCTIRWGCSGKIRVIRVQLDHYNSSNSGQGNYGGGIGGANDYDGGGGYDHPYTSFTNLVELNSGDYVQLSLAEVAVSGQLDLQAQGFASCFWGCLMF